MDRIEYRDLNWPLKERNIWVDGERGIICRVGGQSKVGVEKEGVEALWEK